MARLPQPGGDSGTWGNVLNDYLSQTHKADGTLKDDVVTSATLAPGSVDTTALAPNAVNTNAVADGTIAEAKLSGAVQTKLNASGGPVVSTDIADSTSTGRSLLTSTDATAARTAIGAGTSNLTLGVIAGTAKAGDYAPTKADVGLGNADNTSDANKPVSTATQTALDGKAALSHTHTAANISDSTITGRSLLTAADATAARTAIGAGTSNLTLGTTGGTAKAGDYQPDSTDITDSTATGRSLLTAVDAAAARTAIGVSAADELINPQDFAACGGGVSNDVSTLIGGSGYATLAALREAFWTGCRFVDDDNAVIFDPFTGAGTLYLAAGNQWAHITYNSITGVITFDSSSGGITIGSGVLTGTTGADGSITISGTNSAIYVENRTGSRVSVKWSEARTTDEVDWLALQHAFSYATLRADELGGIVEVVIPPGEYLCDRALFVYSNTKVTNHGWLKLTGGNAIGQFIAIQAADNVELTGGIWDSNFQGNDNTIGVTHIAANQSPLGPASRNIKIHSLKIVGARHGGSHLIDPLDAGEVGHGGGKGVTVQFGGRDVNISNITIDDCDIGFSVEGKEDDSAYGRGGASGISFSDMTVRGSRFMGALLVGRYATPALYGQTFDVRLDNVLFEDCASGLDGESNNVADNFGVVTVDGATLLTGNFVIRNTTGIVTGLRGSLRYSDLKFSIDAPSIKDVINGRAYGGWAGSTSPSRYNQLDVTVLLNGPQANGTGWLCTHAVGSGLEVSQVRIAQQYRDGVTVGTWTGARLIENQVSSTRFEFFSLADGSRIIAGGGYVPVAATGADFTINGVGFDDDPANAQSRMIPRVSRNLTMAHADGAGAIQATAAQPSVDDKTGMRIRVMKGGVVSLDDVELGPAGSGGSQYRMLRIASSGDTAGELYEPYDGDRLITGDAAMPRALTLSNISMTSGTLRLSYFTARSSYTATQVRLLSASTAAGATPTLVRAGLYSEAANGDITLIASFANDTALFASPTTVYTKSFTASVGIVKGTRYALGILVVTAAAVPTVPGFLSALNGSELALGPRIMAAVGSQTDLPSSVVNASLSNNSNRVYGVILP